MNIFSEVSKLGFFKWVNEIDPTYPIPNTEYISEMDKRGKDSIENTIINGLIMRFFRESKGIIHYPMILEISALECKWSYNVIYYTPKALTVQVPNVNVYSTYHEAELACITNMIEFYNAAAQSNQI